MQKYRPIVFMMSLICVVRALSAAWGGSTAVSQKIDPEMLLDKYNSCNKKFETIYYELETTLQVINVFTHSNIALIRKKNNGLVT
jgi:hypothetical protein